MSKPDGGPVYNERNPHEQPINPDPDGKLRAMAESIDKMLDNEKGR